MANPIFDPATAATNKHLLDLVQQSKITNDLLRRMLERLPEPPKQG